MYFHAIVVGGADNDGSADVVRVDNAVDTAAVAAVAVVVDIAAECTLIAADNAVADVQDRIVSVAVAVDGVVLHY